MSHTTESPYAKRALFGVEPYVPGEQPAADAKLIKLNTNENPYPPAPGVFEALAAFDAHTLRRYPDPTQRALRDAAAELLSVPSDWTIAGNGSDELLAMALRAFVDPGDTVAYPVPTYSLYRSLAGMYGARVEERPALLGGPKVAVVRDIDAKLTFIASPNSPDGYPVPAAELDALCEARKGRGVVLVDEAYVDFAEHGALSLVARHDNLLLTRTVSKSFSLAGLRLGIGIAQPSLLAPLWIVKDIYNIDLLTQALGAAALRDGDHMRANAARLVASRQALCGALSQRSWRVFPSAANFVLAEPPGGGGRAVYEALAAKRIYVRHFSDPVLQACVRSSIGSEDEMAQLIDALDALT